MQFTQLRNAKHKYYHYLMSELLRVKRREDMDLILSYSLDCWLEQSSGRAISTGGIRVLMSAGSTKWILS